MTEYAERIKEIEAKKEELRMELSGEIETARIEEIQAEARTLAAEEKEIRAKLDLSEQLKPTNDIPEVKEGRTMTEREERAKALVESGRTEFRAVLATGNIAKPQTAAGVSDLAAIADSIVDDVHAVPLSGTGAWVVAYKSADAIAADVTDGSAVGGTASTYNYVTINPGEWGVVDQISNQVKKMTNVDYLTALEKTALIALRAKAAAKIVAAIKASTLVEKRVSVTLDATYLKNVALNYKGIETKGATMLYISRADLITLGNIRGTNEKKAVYEINFTNAMLTAGTIKEGGLAVNFRVLDSLSAGEQLFGQPGAVDMPMWDNYEIKTDEGGKYFEANQIGIRGLQTAGADLVAYHGMQLIKQSAT